MINQIMKVSIQYNAAFAITGAIRGTYQIKLYSKLSFESPKFRRYTIKKTSLPEYLFNIIPQSNHQYNTRSTEDVTTFYCRIDIFKYYFTSTI